jgi:uncharacterized protein
MMRTLLLWLIRLYQTRVSPYKGFRCAYRARRGRASCSTFGYTAISRHGVVLGLLLLRRRFRKCSAAAASAPPSRQMQSRPKHQAGHCDLPCDLPVGDFQGCDGGHHDACDCLSAAPCDDGGCCDGLWERFRRRRSGRENR